MSSPPRTIADRYRVLEEAGRGGMGSVWRCVDDRLGREVAVKQVGRLPGESVTLRARALREARSSAALNHPNVVSIYDAVAEQDEVWLVMEYVPGRTLAEIVREDGPLSPERAAGIGAQLADGLATAHARGTVHRDVKPGNVLVQGDDLAKISDFGIARTTGDDTLTQTDMMMGTPAYFAPEVARGGSPSPASDVWALGATLFTAVEGRPPYDDRANALAMVSTIATEEPAEPRQAGPLTEPIRRMLDRDPASRWSMTDAAHTLRRVHDRPVADDTSALAAAPVPAPAAAAPLREPHPAPAPAPPSGRRGGLLLVAAVLLVLLASVGAFALLGDDPASSPAADEQSDAAPSPPAEQTPREESSPTQQEQSDATEPNPAPDTASAAPAAAITGSPVAFVEDYYAALPDDTRTGYANLSPSYRADLTYGEYDGFWSTVGDVEILDTTSAGPQAVDVTLRYDGADQEVRRIYLQRGGDGWLIADDEVVG